MGAFRIDTREMMIERVAAQRTPARASTNTGGNGSVPPRGKGECVLVVEDELEIREMVVESLERLGYVTRTAEDAATALCLLDGGGAGNQGAGGQSADGRGAGGQSADGKATIDLLFTDIVMPGGQDGVELAREAKLRWPLLPVLLTSGYVGRSADAIWSRDIPILQKPYRVGTLARAVRACLDGKPAAQPER